MRDKHARASPDRRLAGLAAAHHGVVTRAQLLDIGLTPSAIHRRVQAGRLHPVYRGVYSVGYRSSTREGKWLGAVLACGRGAALSHLDAAELWGLASRDRGAIHVTVPTRSGRAHRPGIRVHRVPLATVEVVRSRGVPVTSPARTLIDIAELLPRRRTERALGEGEYLRLVDGRALEGALEENVGRAGARCLWSILEARALGSTLTRSELEERFLALCRAHRLPHPTVNARVAGVEVDFLWTEQRVIAETDGYAAHGTRAAFERDRKRDVCLQAAGYVVLRFTYRQVVDDASWVVSNLRFALGQTAGEAAGRAGR